MNFNCPICSVPLNVDLYQTEYSNHTYYDYLIGECPQCGRTYSWEEVFSFDHVQNFKMEKEEE